jgi:predicted signal transduction protein with EAL and GGDEF domain
MTIVKAVIAMAHALGMEVVAEGVETAEQLRFLRVEQCDRWQGYLYAPALRMDELKAYIVHGPYWARPTFKLSADAESFSPEQPSASYLLRTDTL